MAFLHGVETISLTIGGRQVTVVKSAVVMLLGFAPTGDSNKLILVQKDSDLAQFGKSISGFTIPKALDDIFKQGAGTVIVNNVYDAATHNTSITAEAQVVANLKIKTTKEPATIGASFVVKNSAGSTTYVKNTDYTVDEFGNVTILNPAITNGTTLKVDYVYFDVTKVTSVEIIGGITSGVRTGMKLFDESKAQFGFAGKLLICPVYCAITAVATAMISYVNTKRAHALIHAPFGTSIATAIAGRGIAGSINFNTNNKRAFLLYPYVKDFNPHTGVAAVSEVSAYTAGLVCAVDSSEGPQVSPSNHEIIGPKGTELFITAEINDLNSDANSLNAVGITTVSMDPGSPYLWGNRNASYPNNTAIDSFFCVVRVADLIEESIEFYSRPYVDKPISPASIDQTVEDVNTFLRTLVGRGWILDGVCSFDPAKNPNTELAAGHVVYDYNFLPPPPAERLTYNSFIDIRLFSKVFGTNQ